MNDKEKESVYTVEDGTTHYDTCYRIHHACAVDRIDRALIMAEEKLAERERENGLLREYEKNFGMPPESMELALQKESWGFAEKLVKILRGML